MASAISKPVILHISGDYPDILNPAKTRAVWSLVEGTKSDFRHIVYSLNRINGWTGQYAIEFDEENLAIAWFAPPKGFFWKSKLKKLARCIIADLDRKHIVPDLVEAHKFSVEGLIGFYVAEHFNKPLVCNVQGDTDTKLLKWKPHWRGDFKKTAQRSALVFSYAPWPLAVFKKFKLDLPETHLLPVVPEVECSSQALPLGRPDLVSVFHLDSYKRKNARGLFRAVKTLLPVYPDIRLDIYGGGGRAALAALSNEIKRLGLQNHIFLKGKTSNRQLPELFRNYAGFVLPSRRETYGLVYAESLLSGLPVLFSKNRAIDGYLKTSDIGYACDPEQPHDIAAGISYLIENEAALKQSITRLRQAGKLAVMEKSSILQVYKNGLWKVLRSAPDYPARQDADHEA